jgi:hypothetical protein
MTADNSNEHPHALHEIAPPTTNDPTPPRVFMWRNKVCPSSPNSFDSSGDNDDDEYLPKYASKWVSNSELMKYMVVQQPQALL